MEACAAVPAAGGYRAAASAGTPVHNYAAGSLMKQCGKQLEDAAGFTR